MKKILIVAHYSRFLVQFELNDVHLLQNMGYEVHYATNYKNEDMYADAPKTIRENGVILHQIDFVRSPYALPANIKAYRQLKSLMEKEQFSGVHCHTPMAGALARLAANATHTQPVLYTAHGFHFYKGCPLKNRLIYETAEKFLARYTDAQITINQEDYAAAQNFPLRGKAYYIPGVGIDVSKIAEQQVDRDTTRKKLGIPRNAEVYVTVGELIPRKNHVTLIDAFVQANIPQSILLICGSGVEKNNLTDRIRAAHAEKKIKLLGFRDDITEILKASDIFVFPSKQEGLPVALMEAMASGLPCAASKIRGNTDLLGKDYKYLFGATDISNLVITLQNISQNKENAARECFKRIQPFNISAVETQMRIVYSQLLSKK